MEKAIASSKVRLFLPHHVRLIINDVMGHSLHGVVNNTEHIREAVNWIGHAQDVAGDGGVPAQYSLVRGWRASAIETTGYIVPTFFDYYHFTLDPVYKKRAVRMCDFLVGTQLSNGSFQGGTSVDPPKPVVFCTGQCLLGVLRGFEETGDRKYLESAVQAGDWLVDVQDARGFWLAHTYNNMRHVYHARVAWILLKLFKITNERKYAECAVKNLEWALSKQRHNGWFDECGFVQGALPFTHTIAYTARGFLESSLLLNSEEYLRAAQKTGDALLNVFSRNNLLAGSYDQNWQSNDTYSCLTGCAQTAIIWFKLSQALREHRYLRSALRMNRFLKGLQNTSTLFRPFRGAVKGSHPVYGRYLRFSFPNWAAKFFIDSLMLEQSIGGAQNLYNVIV